MKTNHPLVHVSPLYFLRVLGIIEEMGLSRKIVLKELGVELTKQPNPKTRYNLELFDNLLTIAARELDDPHIGITVGERFRIATYTNLGNILAFSKDIEEAAYINKRYSSLVHTLGIPHLKKEDFGNGLKDTFLWEPNFPKSHYQKFYKTTEFVISNYLTTLNWLAWGFGVGVTEVHYAHAPAEPKIVCDELLGCMNKFEANNYRLVMTDNIMKRPLPTANAHQLNILKKKQDTILNAFNNTNSLISRVEGAILNVIQNQKPTIKVIAQSLNINERTMKRHLKSQVTSYSEILEKVKRNMCEDLMANGTGLAEIAQILWYNDQAAFTRAYKNWYGDSPTKRGKK